MDVGCGTGILSMIAAKAGAKHIYAIEMSDMADKDVSIIATNDLTDKITVIKQRIEEVTIVKEVDNIVSDWMGYCLFL
jgi:ribosomal protein L11 methylase PrmA